MDVRVQELPENGVIGQRAEVFIETGHRSNVVSLPSAFVRWRGNKPGVFHGRARWRRVTLGLRGWENVEVINGLSTGEQVVRPGAGQKQPLLEDQRIAAK